MWKTIVFCLNSVRKLFSFLPTPIITSDYFDKMLTDASVNTLFVNLLYVNKPAGREIIRRIHPEQLVVYHIPFEKGRHHAFSAHRTERLEKVRGYPPENNFAARRNAGNRTRLKSVYRLERQPTGCLSFLLDFSETFYKILMDS